MKKTVVLLISLTTILVSFNSSFASLVDGLVAYYPFNGNAIDASGNGNNGTVHGATLTTDRFGNPNMAYHFDGINDYVNCGNSSDFNFDYGITISAWVKTDATDNGGFIISKKTRNHENKYLIVDNKAYAYYYYTTNEQPVYSSPVPHDEWIHVAATYNGSTSKIYINGQLSNSIPASGNIVDYVSNLYIGANVDQNYGYYGGCIDDVRVYNRALSSAEILALYTEPNPVVPLPAALWLFGSGLLGIVALKRKTAK